MFYTVSRMFETGVCEYKTVPSGAASMGASGASGVDVPNAWVSGCCGGCDEDSAMVCASDANGFSDTVSSVVAASVMGTFSSLANLLCRGVAIHCGRVRNIGDVVVTSVQGLQRRVVDGEESAFSVVRRRRYLTHAISLSARGPCAV